MEWTHWLITQPQQNKAKHVHIVWDILPDSKVHGANMGPIWGRQDPGGPHVGPMNFAIWSVYVYEKSNLNN